MATYLQGETGIIPSIQPFDPNLNLISTVLKNKDTQFDNNFKQLNKIYNSYVFADLTRADNLQRRDGLVKQIDLDLKRMATLDLSQEKNVNQAIRVFAPLYEDPYIMDDMARTKNYKAARSGALALNQSKDKEKRGQFWNEGVQYMDYVMEEYKNMPLEESLQADQPRYVPFVNVAEKLTKLAKENNLEVEADSFSKDGMYIITDKNGSLLVDPLSRLFRENIANDPAVQDLYRVKAYLDRKNTANANSSRLGSVEAAEQEYLISRYNQLQQWSTQLNNQNNQQLRDKNSTIANINKSYQNGTYTDRTDEALREQEQSKARIQSEVDESTALVNDLSDGKSSTVSLLKSGNDITQNIGLLRNVVDNATASLLMENDIFAAADAWASTHLKHKINVNPVGLENLRHGHRMSEIDRRAKHNQDAIVLKNNLDSGVWVSDMYGQVSINPELTARLEKNMLGSSTGKENANKVNKQYESELANQQATPAVNMIFEYLQNEVNAGNMSDKQAGAFFSYKGKTLDEVKKIYQSNPGQFFTKYGYSADKTYNDFIRYVQTNKKGDPTAEQIINSEQFANFNQYSEFSKAARKVNNENLKIAQDMVGEGIYEAGLASDWNPLGTDVYVGLPRQDRLLLDKELPKLFITSLSGPVTEGSFKKAAWKNPKIADVLMKISLIRAGQNGGSGFDYLGKVYDKYLANWETKKDNTKFKSYYVGNYVPGIQGSEYALTSGNATGLTVFPNAYGTPNRTIWTETMEDVNNMSTLLASGGAKISFNGLQPEGSGDNTQTGLAVLSYLNNRMASKDKKPGNFEIYQSQIALENPQKGAMIIYPNAEDLKDLVGTDKSPGIITAEERNAIIKNGISIIGPRNSFNNFLFKESGITPLEAQINANGSYEYKNPGGSGYYNITRAGDGYNITGKLNQRDANTGEMTTSDINQIGSFGQYGNNIDFVNQNLQQSLIQVENQNQQIHRNFNPVKR